MRIAFGVTGGAGFIGINLCEKLVLAGHPVVIFDDLSRVGAEKNLIWLREKYPHKVDFSRRYIHRRRKLKRIRRTFRCNFPSSWASRRNQVSHRS